MVRTRKGEQLDEITFEGYGPGGVAMLVQVVTNARNRPVRLKFVTHLAKMAEIWRRPQGAVGWMFKRKGEIAVPKELAEEDKIMGIVFDAGAEDLQDGGAAWEIVTPPEAFEAVRAMRW